MHTIRTLVFFLLLAGFGAHAQIQNEYDSRGGKAEIAKMVSIYPNPAVEFVNVKFTHVPAAHVKVSLYNIIGNEVPVEIENIDEHEVRLRVKELSSGYYLIVFKDPQDRFQGTFKILKR